MEKFILEAAKFSYINGGREDRRNFQLGAIGFRADGAKVAARNGSVRIGEIYSGGWSYAHAHAERKLCKKMDHGGIVYVARVSKQDGTLKNSRPCYDCMLALRAKKVLKCYYSINEFQYGMIDFSNNEYERVFGTHPEG